MSWAEVSAALQAEDNARRQSNTDHPESLLPLGWTRRGERAVASPVRAGSPARRETGSSSGSGSSGRSSSTSTPAQAAPAGGGSRPSSPGRSFQRRPGGGGGGQSSGSAPIFVC
jgi:hypothetical protein